MWKPAALDPSVFGWLGLSELLAARATCRAWRRRLAPNIRALWAAVRPRARDVHWALASPSPAAARLATEAYTLTAADARADGNFALRTACTRGHLATAIWLVNRFGLTAADARAAENWALSFACTDGRLAVAIWLTELFGLTAADARSCDCWAVRSAYDFGHLPVVVWLVDRFALTAADAKAVRNAAYRRATEGSHPAVVQWLMGRFPDATGRPAAP